MTIDLLKFLGLSVGPVLILGILYVIIGNKKNKEERKNPLLDDNKEEG